MSTDALQSCGWDVNGQDGCGMGETWYPNGPGGEAAADLQWTPCDPAAQVSFILNYENMNIANKIQVFRNGKYLRVGCRE